MLSLMQIIITTISVIFTLSLVFFIKPFSAFAQGQSFSLKDALKYGIERNPVFRNALVEEQISAEKTNEVSNRYLPRLSATLDGRYNTQIATQVLPAKAFNPNAGENELTELRFGTNWNASAALDLTQPILDLSLGAEAASAKASQNLASANTEQAKQDLKMAIARAYYTVLLNEEKLRQAESNLERTENFFNNIESKFANANALKTDRSRAYLNFSNAKLAKKKAQDAVRLSKMNLALQLSWEGKPDEIKLTEKLDALFAADNAFQNRSLEAAWETRSDAKAELARREVNIKTLDRLRNQNLPTLSGYGFLGTQGFGNEFGTINFFPLSYIGVRASIPLADWFTRTSTIQQQALQLDKTENTLRNLRQTALYQLEETQTALQNAVQSVKIQKENIVIAEEVIATTTTRFKQGQATQQEVLDAENTLRDTQVNYLQALYDALVAKLDWERANGML